MKISTKQATTAAAILLAAYFLFTEKGKQQLAQFLAQFKAPTDGNQQPNYTPQVATPATPGAPASQPANSPLNYSLLLKKGSKNNEVKELQNWLNQVGILFTEKLPLTGYFGTKTEARLKNIYQLTECTLQQVMANTTPSTASTTDTGWTFGNWFTGW
jgi:hypothetical protein